MTSTESEPGLLPCPCCFQPTLEERANFEICPECGWEDDGQDDADAHVVRGGPNGSLSLTRARAEFAEALTEDQHDESLTRGGAGMWLAEARRQPGALPGGPAGLL
ncbi:CPCC family cysteine-rich protein [Streptomyces sp. 11x1]|uniref:CPCC family cysteine-rich protein n=1 Tax=Streptomyces sp. 11x1 TaxID=3038642 RepID=UPI00292EA399|nr:CPCC family cysteine-rich protein [Streptomyces sp. 11x1]WNZ10622.1 CPCC family cysteine-rich protein [Streptomyces sp. 11x1]